MALAAADSISQPGCMLPDPNVLFEWSRGWWGPKDAKYFSIDTRFNGPIEESNMVLPGILYAGWFPSIAEVHQMRSNGIINLFVRLNTDEEITKKHFDRYMDTLPIDYCNKMDWVDMQPVDVNALLEKCKEVASRICSGQRVYVHCAGGHGRTGTFVSVLLYILYKKYSISIEKILEYVQYAHDQRPSSKHFLATGQDYAKRIEVNIKGRYVPGQIPSPQTSAQQNLVYAACKLYDDEIQVQIQAQIEAQKLLEQSPGHDAEITQHVGTQLREQFGVLATDIQGALEKRDETQMERIGEEPEQYYKAGDTKEDPIGDPLGGSWDALVGLGGKGKKQNKCKKIRKSRKFR